MPLMAGRDVLLEVLRQEGVALIFGNPGSTELPLMDTTQLHAEAAVDRALEPETAR